MTNAGWYPDPAGQPQTYRYWDGQSWSAETTGDPYAPAPGSTPPQHGTGYGQSGFGDATVATPQQPQQSYPPQPPQPPQPPAGPPPSTPGVPAGYGAIPPSQPGYGQGAYGGGPGQPGYGPLPTSTPPPGGRGSGTTIAVVLIAVLVLVALGVGGFFGVKALTSDDDTTAGDDSSETVDETDDPTDPSDPTTDASDPTTGPSESTTGPTDPTTGATPTTLQCNGGFPAPEEPRKDDQISGGGLTIPVVSGFDVDTLQAGAFTFTDEFTPQIRIIEDGWIALYGVGALNKANGFETPEQAAEVVTQCMTASSQIYDGFSDRTDLESGPITIDGREGFSLETEIRVDNPEISVEGDRAQVIVVDTGDADTWGLYISVVALGDLTLIDQQADTVDEITVQ